MVPKPKKTPEQEFEAMMPRKKAGIAAADYDAMMKRYVANQSQPQAAPTQPLSAEQAQARLGSMAERRAADSTQRTMLMERQYTKLPPDRAADIIRRRQNALDLEVAARAPAPRNAVGPALPATSLADQAIDLRAAPGIEAQARVDQRNRAYETDRAYRMQLAERMRNAELAGVGDMSQQVADSAEARRLALTDQAARTGAMTAESAAKVGMSAAQIADMQRRGLLAEAEGQRAQRQFDTDITYRPKQLESELATNAARQQGMEAQTEQTRATTRLNEQLGLSNVGRTMAENEAAIDIMRRRLPNNANLTPEARAAELDARAGAMELAGVDENLLSTYENAVGQLTGQLGREFFGNNRTVGGSMLTGNPESFVQPVNTMETAVSRLSEVAAMNPAVARQLAQSMLTQLPSNNIVATDPFPMRDSARGGPEAIANSNLGARRQIADRINRLRATLMQIAGTSTATLR